MATQTTTTVQVTTIDYDSASPSHCSFSPAGPFYLENGGELTISFSGFPEGSTFTQLTLQGITSVGTVITYPPQSGGTSIFSISSSGDQPPTELKITITDVEKPTSEDEYELSLTGQTGSGGNWSADPEVINKPGG